MALRYILLLMFIFPDIGYAKEKEAQDALTRAVMKIPLISESKKYWEKKARTSDFKMLFYLGQ